MNGSRLKNQVIAIVGTNASGKSSLAIAIARKFKGEIISADSRQVYRGMDIGSGKVTKKERSLVPHYLLDVASPKRDFAVTHFVTEASRKIREIQRRGHIPVICGGTGFWVDALCLGTEFPNVPPNKMLRRNLSKQSVNDLYLKLKRLDPKRARTIDKKNSRRLIRALEIIAATKKTIPKMKTSHPYDVLWIGIKKTQDELKRRIHRRLKARLKTGLIAEVRRLHTNGLSWKRLEGFGLEYRFIALYLQKKISHDEMLKSLELAIRKYAKRQTTWFKRNNQIHWVRSQHDAFLKTKKWIKKESPTLGTREE